MKLKFDETIRAAAPHLKAVLITAYICNSPTSDELWSRIDAEAQRLAESLKIEQINKIPSILATRQAYKACGKDPNRYRPSAEALTRRAVKGLDLYRTSSVVDLINLVSLATGHSIGAFDADKIESDGELTLGVGREGEPYEAIGRGTLNIAGLPVWRDTLGGIGTPTSDNERTKLTDDTRRLAVIVNCYADQPEAAATAAMINDLLREFAAAENVEVNIFSP